MKKFLKLFINLCIIVGLTVLTQVGGLAYLISLAYFKKLRIYKRIRLAKLINFLIVYLVLTFAFVPIIAPLFGRVALPMRGNVKPLTYITCLLNRHYVSPELKAMIKKVGGEIKIKYLDANFPFFNGFPLFPHLSHSDGKKLDLALYFIKNGKSVNYAKSAIGYGGSVLPIKGEEDKPDECEKKGYWQYSLLHDFLPDFLRNEVTFDKNRTKKLIELLLKQPELEKLFIEPHLVTRMELTHSKIRFHGCHAVRHDDHIHLQVK